MASQVTQQAEQFMDATGTGAFSFGEENLNQENILAVQYSMGSTQLFGLLKNGNLIKNESTLGSYIEVENAQFAELKMGLVHQSQNKDIWGLQAYNQNTLLDADINLRLPTGMSANGQMESDTIRFHHQGNLAPDSIEFFYQSKVFKDDFYQLNLVKTPDDSGFALQLQSPF